MIHSPLKLAASTVELPGITFLFLWEQWGYFIKYPVTPRLASNNEGKMVVKRSTPGGGDVGAPQGHQHVLAVLRALGCTTSLT